MPDFAEVPPLIAFTDFTRYDVLGKAVNTTARLLATGIALSAEAFRALAPATRQLFRKHTPPITHIRQEDPHR